MSEREGRGVAVAAGPNEGHSGGTTGASPAPSDSVPGPPRSAAFLVMALGTRIRAQAEQALRAEDIGLRHFSALGHLARQPGVSYSELARRAHVTQQSMQATLQQLEQRGAVERVGGAGRGRAAHLHVTDEGRRLLAVGREVLSAVDEALTRELGAKRSAQFLDTVDAVVRNELWRTDGGARPADTVRRKEEP
jgi:DNA-binding MarR family transcriptional regulator